MLKSRGTNIEPCFLFFKQLSICLRAPASNPYAPNLAINKSFFNVPKCLYQVWLFKCSKTVGKIVTFLRRKCLCFSQVIFFLSIKLSLQIKLLIFPGLSAKKNDIRFPLEKISFCKKYYSVKKKFIPEKKFHSIKEKFIL